MAVSTRLTAREGRRFAFTVGIAFLVIGSISAWRGHIWPPRLLWTIGGTLLLAGVLLPGRLGPVYHRWMALAAAISRVTSPIVVGVAYFVVLSPIGLLLRALGRNPLEHREGEEGFWSPAPRRSPSDLENQF